MSDDPGSQPASGRVRCTVDFPGGDFRCAVRHEPSGARFETDAPADNCGKGEAFSPTDLLAASLASCMVTTMAIAARKDGSSLPPVSVTVDKEMSADAPRRVARLTAEIKIPLPPSYPARKRLEQAALGCPVQRSLSPETEVTVSFRWSEEGQP